MSLQSQNYQRSSPKKNSLGSSRQPEHYPSPPQSSFGSDGASLTSPRDQINVNDQYTNISDNVSPTNKAKSAYILKEQKLRAKMLEQETKQVLILSGTSHRDFSLSIQKTETDSADSMFDQNDWTPQNSSYGGAFPLCGWIPKRIRQATESILLVVVGFGTIYFIVSVATKLTGSVSSSSGSSSMYDEFDDDHYVVAGNDDAEYVAYNVYDDDTDDWYTNDDNSNANTSYYNNDDAGGRLRNLSAR